MPDIKLIAAIDNARGIAKGGKLPWDVPSDRKYFQEHIQAGPVLMGWNTFIANNAKPYGRGKNFVLTHHPQSVEGVEIIHDLEAFLHSHNEDLWVAGGGQVFSEILPYATHLFLTRIPGDFACDIFFPQFERDFKRITSSEAHTENGLTFHYELWVKKQY